MVLAIPESGTPEAVTTGENGAFRFDLPEGRYRVVAGKLILSVATEDLGVELWCLDLSSLFASGFETGDLSEWF